ncbi:hypothetical protein SEMRO_84_G044970.1 [Seminavis robusta]|uniref:Uncharacterized protein n=1 Tax=Seminavis robusta TaxID=568900 RepID=A0A9N8DGU6_9STRA|nr:hypothetical protein SEMRO_84_G044970.1 [Seminavis robusta]|eukprot:Sro84_g044970.1 n/a (114) ;mRNA; r:87850-88191
MTSTEAAVAGEDEEEDKKWISSEAKMLLRQDLISGDIPPSMGAAAAYQRRPEFQQFPFNNFSSNYGTLKRKIAKDYNRVESDLISYQFDLAHVAELRNKNPPPPKKYPEWHSH